MLQKNQMHACYEMSDSLTKSATGQWVKTMAAHAAVPSDTPRKQNSFK